MIENRRVLDNVNALLKYENVKDYLFINVINAYTNKQELENMPHTIIGDLAIIYRVMIPKYIPIETFLLGVPENVAYREKDKQLIIVSNEHNTGGAVLLNGWC